MGVPPVFQGDISEEHVEFFMLRRKQKNFISGKANFAVGCGQSGEKFNEGLK
jgi:hypothetical protein